MDSLMRTIPFISANLKSALIEISASDWLAGPDYLPHVGNTFSIMLAGGTLAEAENIFQGLSENAKPDHFQSLHEMPFGVYGQLTDKFWPRWIFLVTNTGRS